MDSIVSSTSLLSKGLFYIVTHKSFVYHKKSYPTYHYVGHIQDPTICQHSRSRHCHDRVSHLNCVFLRPPHIKFTQTLVPYLHLHFIKNPSHPLPASFFTPCLP